MNIIFTQHDCYKIILKTIRLIYIYVLFFNTNIVTHTIYLPKRNPYFFKLNLLFYHLLDCFDECPS